MDQGFDEFFGFTDAYHAFEKFPRTLWDRRAWRPVSGYADDLFTDRGVNFIRRAVDRPFFLYPPYISAHFNIEAPADKVATHRGKFPEADPSRPLNATDAVMVTRLDKNVGRILDAIDEAGLADDTIVVFTSDHGASFEAGNLGTSAALGSNRLAGPGRVGGRLAGGRPDDRPHADPPRRGGRGPRPVVEGRRGRPAPVVDGPFVRPDRTLFWGWRSEGFHGLAALLDDLKLIVTRDGPPELYDVVADPEERRDIAATNPDAVRRLGGELAAWIATETEPRPEPSPLARLSSPRTTR